MFKRIFTQLIVVAILMGGWVLYGERDQIKGFFTSASDEAKNLANSVTPDSSTAAYGGGKAYKWQDGSGQWHYGENPPQDAMNVTSIATNDEVNVMSTPEEVGLNASINTKQSNQDPSGGAMEGIGGGSGGALPIPDPKMVKKLIEQAQQVQDLMDNRVDMLDAAIEGREPGESDKGRRSASSSSSGGGISSSH